LFKVQLETRC